MHQGLEDKFDGANRMNLRHFISPDEKASEANYDEDGEELDPGLPPYFYLPNPAEQAAGEKMVQERRMLQRIPTCAVFHKIASGKGVPHTFVGTCHIIFIIKTRSSVVGRLRPSMAGSSTRCRMSTSRPIFRFIDITRK